MTWGKPEQAELHRGRLQSRSEPLFQYGGRGDEGFGASMIGVLASGQHGITWQRVFVVQGCLS